MIIIVPIVLGGGKVHSWRYGIIGLLVPITYLLMATAYVIHLIPEIEENLFRFSLNLNSRMVLGFWLSWLGWLDYSIHYWLNDNGLITSECACRNSFFLQSDTIESHKSASNAVLAGSIIGSVANLFLIMLFGIRDEKFKEVEAWGSRFEAFCLSHWHGMNERYIGLLQGTL